MFEMTEKKEYSTVTEYESHRMENLKLATDAHKISCEIESDEKYIYASDLLMKIKERRRWWEKLIEPAIEAAHVAHKRMIAVRKEVDMPLERAENEFLKPALLRYSEKKEAERKAAEAKINLMLKQEAEQKRIEQEAQKEKTSLIDLNGQAIPSVATPPPPPPIIPTVVLPKAEEPKGISYVTTYNAEVVDLKALIEAVHLGQIPMEALQPNMSFIRGRAKMMKTLLQWPGVVVKEEKQVRASSTGR